MRRRALLAAALGTAPGCAAAQATAAPGARVGTPLGLPDIPPGPLRPLGGLVIDARALGFGGFSGLHLAPDLTVTAVSDLARFAEFTLQADAAGRPQALILRRAGRLRDGAGRPLPRGQAGDAEALARLPDGSWLVAFERWHRIRRYADLDGPGSYVAAPPGLERAPANGGLETLALLADGRWLAIAEDLARPEAPEVAAAWLAPPGGPGGAGDWMALGWRMGAGMLPVDAAGLPDGGALVLERSFSLFGGFAGRVVHLPPAALAAARPGTVLAGEEVLRLAPPLPADNHEGIAVVRHAGRTLVATISDDNENGLQRSLLLLFEWQGPG